MAFNRQVIVLFSNADSSPSALGKYVFDGIPKLCKGTRKPRTHEVWVFVAGHLFRISLVVEHSQIATPEQSRGVYKYVSTGCYSL